jgi:hypothetical protein
MFRKIIISFIALLFFLIAPHKIYAQEEFIIDVSVNYSVQSTGITKVTHTITLENALSNLYAQSYLLSLENINPIDPVSFEGTKQLALTKTEKNDTISLQVIFDDAVVGKGKTRTFTISFEESSFASRTGEVWEISIPRLSESNNFRSYNINLIVPSSFGKEAYISPDPKSIYAGENTITYGFDKASIQKTGITAGFGKFQVFSFSLNYHLENPLNKTASTEIAIPPDTAFQKIYYDSINPAPEEVYLDEDGNWLAVYILSPRERIDVTAMGTVQIYANPREIQIVTSEILQENLKESEYWQVNDPQIQNLAGTLRTPKAIYDFVSTNLSYSYDRVRPNVTRYGASLALTSPNDAICMEYTDLFIALARAAGIPAREINGYAYTENPEIQPLSLVADVLHSWPEYWDEQRHVWIPVDPTWGSTTGGVDFFSKLDLRHFTFVIHGKDDTTPYPPGSYKLGPSPQKDVFVNFGQLPKERISKPEINAKVKNSLPFMHTQISVTIKNPGPTALYNLEPAIYFDEILAERTIIPVLLPYASYEFKSHIPFSFLGTKTPEKIVVIVGDTEVQIPSNKTQVIIYNLLAIFFVFSFIIAVVVIKIKKITLAKVKDRLLTIPARFKLKKSKKEEDNNIQV